MHLRYFYRRDVAQRNHSGSASPASCGGDPHVMTIVGGIVAWPSMRAASRIAPGGRRQYGCHSRRAGHLRGIAHA